MRHHSEFRVRSDAVVKIVWFKKVVCCNLSSFSRWQTRFYDSFGFHLMGCIVGAVPTNDRAYFCWVEAIENTCPPVMLSQFVVSLVGGVAEVSWSAVIM